MQTTRFNDLFEYNIETETWSQPEASGDLPDARAHHTASLVMGNMVVRYLHLHRVQTHLR